VKKKILCRQCGHEEASVSLVHCANLGTPWLTIQFTYQAQDAFSEDWVDIHLPVTWGRYVLGVALVLRGRDCGTQKECSPEVTEQVLGKLGSPVHSTSMLRPFLHQSLVLPSI
jgi:hypothetical protein